MPPTMPTTMSLTLPLARSAILRAGISVKCQARDQPEHGNFNNVPQ